MVELLEVIRQGFIDEKWWFECFTGDNPNGFYTTIITPNAQWRCTGMIHQDVFVFNSAFSIPASMEKRKSMAELLVRINYRMAFGNFNMCFTDGIVELRSAILIEDGFSPGKATNLVKRNIAMMEDWYLVILKVMLHECTPEDAIDQLFISPVTSCEGHNECEDHTIAKSNNNMYCCSQCDAKEQISSNVLADYFSSRDITSGICQSCFEQQIVNEDCFTDWQCYYRLECADKERKEILRRYQMKAIRTVGGLIFQWIDSIRLENIDEVAYSYIINHNRISEKGWYKSLIHEYLKNNKVRVMNALNDYIASQPVWKELQQQYIQEGTVFANEIRQLINKIGSKRIIAVTPANKDSLEFLVSLSTCDQGDSQKFPENKAGYYFLRKMRVDTFVCGLPELRPQLPEFYEIERNLRKALSAKLHGDLRMLPSHC